LPSLRVFALTVIAMFMFAGNSLLCRIALRHTAIDAASFTTIRIVSGALMLALIVGLRRGGQVGRGSWASAVALVAYAAAFSFAYVALPAGAGALILFGAVQATMIGHGILSGERMLKSQLVGLLIALAGLIGLFLPGLSAPPLAGSALMLGAGISWGIYSLRGRGAGDPTRVTAGNFLRAVPIAALISVIAYKHGSLDRPGILAAVASGGVTSGIGYAIWYAALPALKSTNAATVQLSVPVIAAIGGIALLSEPLTARLALSSVAILGGIALVLSAKGAAVRAREAVRMD
jgi:drug/metabolite transporter (DMT)-like permease